MALSNKPLWLLERAQQALSRIQSISLPNFWTTAAIFAIAWWALILSSWKWEAAELWQPVEPVKEPARELKTNWTSCNVTWLRSDTYALRIRNDKWVITWYMKKWETDWFLVDPKKTIRVENEKWRFLKTNPVQKNWEQVWYAPAKRLVIDCLQQQAYRPNWWEIGIKPTSVILADWSWTKTPPLPSTPPKPAEPERKKPSKPEKPKWWKWPTWVPPPENHFNNPLKTHMAYNALWNNSPNYSPVQSNVAFWVDLSTRWMVFKEWAVLMQTYATQTFDTWIEKICKSHDFTPKYLQSFMWVAGEKREHCLRIEIWWMFRKFVQSASSRTKEWLRKFREECKDMVNAKLADCKKWAIAAAESQARTQDLVHLKKMHQSLWAEWSVPFEKIQASFAKDHKTWTQALFWLRETLRIWVAHWAESSALSSALYDALFRWMTSSDPLWYFKRIEERTAKYHWITIEPTTDGAIQANNAFTEIRLGLQKIKKVQVVNDVPYAEKVKSWFEVIELALIKLPELRELKKLFANRMRGEDDVQTIAHTFTVIVNWESSFNPKALWRLWEKGYYQMKKAYQEHYWCQKPENLYESTQCVARAFIVQFRNNPHLINDIFAAERVVNAHNAWAWTLERQGTYKMTQYMRDLWERFRWLLWSIWADNNLGVQNMFGMRHQELAQAGAY